MGERDFFNSGGAEGLISKKGVFERERNKKLITREGDVKKYLQLSG